MRRTTTFDLPGLLGWLAALVALVAIGLFVRDALVLVAYPYDWDPGEGLLIDMAIRLRQHGLAALYPAGDVVPAPFTYSPLVPALLALVPAGALMAAGRLLGLGCALAAALAVYMLVRTRARRPVAVAFAALALAPASHTFWLVLVRTDAALIACWLWAAVFLLPARLVRRSETLSWKRTLAGAALLVLAALAKPTAVILGAPLVAAWWLVDGRSAVRLTALTLLAGAAAFAALQLATAGGFWRALAFQRLAESIPGQTLHLLRGSLVIYAASVAFTVLAAVLAGLRRDGSLRDGAWLVWVAGPLTIPLLAKEGATFNYALPWAMAQAALAGRLLGPGWPAAAGRMVFASDGARAGLVSLAAVALMLGRFPLPTHADRQTAASFYGFIAERGGPILAVHPDLAYVKAGQPVLLEMAIFPRLYEHGLPGTKALFARLDRLEFKTVVENLDRWSLAAKGYVAVGACQLAFHYGPTRFLLMVPAAEAPFVKLVPQPEARCLARRP